jgi:AraC-like DNA-binding protein
MSFRMTWHRPGPPLADFVDVIWMWKGYSPPHARERLMPTGQLELIIMLGESDCDGSGLAGAQSQYFEIDTSRPFSVLGVHFKSGGAFPFFGMPAGEFQDQSVSLDAVWGRDAGCVFDQILAARTAAQRFRIVERALLQRSRGRLCRHPAVRFALNAFDAAPATHRVSDIVDAVGMTPRQFIETFRAEVGLAPKLYWRIRRFQQVLAAIERIQDPDWSDVALACGYFDQAHFNHDFREFSGMTPSVYITDRHSRNHVALHG